MVSKMVRAGLMAAVLCSGWTSSDAVAQMVVSADLPAKTVRVRVAGVPLKEALQHIAQQAGLTAVYGGMVVNSGQRVTLDLRDVPVAEAFELALAGTNLRATIVAGNVAFGLLSESASVQGTVVGKVVNAKTKQPIAGVRVHVGNAQPGMTTDEKGTFRLSLEAGEYAIHFRGVGFGQQIKRVKVKAGESSVLEVTLEPSTSVLDEVVVTGTVVETERKAIATPITVITGEELQRRGIMRIEQLFRGEVPGVFAFDQGSEVYRSTDLGVMETAKVYARGSSTLPDRQLGVFVGTNPLKTYIDGVELLDPNYLGTIDPASIDRIEMIVGPQAATVYGSGAMGGVMQIFTKKGSHRQTPDLTLNLRYGLLQNNLSDGLTPTHDHVANITGGSGSGFSYASSLSYNYSGQWQPFLFSRRTGVSIGATYAPGTVTVTGSANLTNGQNGTAGSSPLEQKRRADGTWVGYGGGIASTQLRSGSKSQMLSLNLDHRPVTFWQHHFTVGISQTDFTLEPDAPRFATFMDSLFRVRSSTGERTSVAYNMSFRLNQREWWTSNLTLGFTGSSARQSATDGCLATKSVTTMMPCNPPPSGFIAVTTSHDESSGGFGSWQVGLFNQLYVTLGVRGERNPNYGRAHKIDWTPTQGIAYTMDMGDLSLKLLGSYGRATRPPTPDQRLEKHEFEDDFMPSSWIGRRSNPDLRPEYSRGPQGGIEAYYGNLGSLTLNRYSQTVTDLIQEVLVDSVAGVLSGFLDWWQPVKQYQNTATIRQRGWEMRGTLNVGRLAFRGTWSWNDNRVIATNPTSTTQLRSGTVFMGIPTSTGNVGLTYAHDGTSVNLSTSIVGRVLRDGYGGPAGQVLYTENQYSRFPAYVSLRRSDYNMIMAAYTVSGYTKSDLSMLHRLNAWASLTLHMTNLENSFGSESVSVYPTLGRQTKIGVTLRYPTGTVAR